MQSRFLSCLILVGTILTVTTVNAEQKKVYALVPKLMHPFFELAHKGCDAAASELNVECLYVGPAKSGDSEQIQILQDLIARGVDGIAIAPANAPAVGRILKQAKAAGINIITFDSDLLEKDKELRSTYIGTNNYEIGVALAKKVLELKPSGGTYAVQSGGAAAVNLNERLQGVRDTLGKNWQEVPGTPVFCNDDSALAIQQMEDLLAKYENLDAFIAIGGWPQFAKQAYQTVIKKHIERINSNQLVMAVADTLPMQMEVLAQGLSHVQVGQKPFDMGYRSIKALVQIGKGEQLNDPIYTGLDVCEASNIETCLAPGKAG